MRGVTPETALFCVSSSVTRTLACAVPFAVSGLLVGVTGSTSTIEMPGFTPPGVTVSGLSSMWTVPPAGKSTSAVMV